MSLLQYTYGYTHRYLDHIADTCGTRLPPQLSLLLYGPAYSVKKVRPHLLNTSETEEQELQ